MDRETARRRDQVMRAFFEGKEPGLVNAVLDRLARVVRDDAAAADQDEGGTGDGAAHR